MAKIKEDFINYVIEIYKQNFLTLGFIPSKRFFEYYDKGQFFIDEDDSFILTGSLKSKIISIYAIYVNPISRKKGINKIISLIKMLPENRIYRVRCVIGYNFWKRMGLIEINQEKNNKRKRIIHVLEGKFKI